MSLFENGEGIYTIVSIIVDADKHPCGCKQKTHVWQYTHVVKGYRQTVAECPDCGATWDDIL